MKAVEQMLYSTLSGDATLSALAPGGVWRGVAPGDVDGIVVVFQQMGASDVYALASRAFTTSTYQVKAIQPGESSAGAWAAAERIEALLTDTSLTLTSGEVMACRRSTTLSLNEIDGGEQYQHVGGLYSISVQE